MQFDSSKSKETGTSHNRSRRNSRSNHSSIKSPSSPVRKEKKEQYSILDRLRIVNTESSSSRKKKYRRSHGRNDGPLPEELLFQHGQQDNVSMIPDSFSNSNTFSKDEGWNVDPVPALFTFDLVPSLSEDSYCKSRDDEYEDGNNTTDANCDEKDGSSAASYQSEGSDYDYDNDLVEYHSKDEQYNEANTTVYETSNKRNMETLIALSKLELNTRTRTESTAFLSEVSSNESSLQLLDNERTEVLEEPSKPVGILQDELVTSTSRDEIHEQASRCTFNLFSIFS